MAVTIKDVAAAAGVSPSTVSRTCKDSPSISRETKERVRRIMAQLGYEPNVEAEPVEAFSKTIGIILPSSQRDVYENAFHLEIIRGIGQFCNQRRYVNTVITGQDDAEVLDAIQSMVANAQADGFILLYSKKDCPVAAYLRNEGLLHVIVGKAAQSANQTIYIDNDNALAGEEAADYLYELGHRDILYFGQRPGSTTHQLRADGYMKACHEFNLTPHFFNSEYSRSSIQGGYQLAKELFRKPLDCTAVFAATDSNALGILTAADEMGIDIPGHLSLIGFDNISATALSRIDLTTVDQPKRDMAVQAVDMLRDKIENGTQGYVHQILLPTLIQRGTCRKLHGRI